jgi:hypothetical protein
MRGGDREAGSAYEIAAPEFGLGSRAKDRPGHTVWGAKLSPDHLEFPRGDNRRFVQMEGAQMKQQHVFAIAGANYDASNVRASVF